MDLYLYWPTSISIGWVVREEADPWASTHICPAFEPEKCHLEDTDSIVDMMFKYMSHNNYCYQEDKATLYGYLGISLKGSSLET